MVLRNARVHLKTVHSLRIGCKTCVAGRPSFFVFYFYFIFLFFFVCSLVPSLFSKSEVAQCTGDVFLGSLSLPGWEMVFDFLEHLL